MPAFKTGNDGEIYRTWNLDFVVTHVPSESTADNIRVKVSVFFTGYGTSDLLGHETTDEEFSKTDSGPIIKAADRIGDDLAETVMSNTFAAREERGSSILKEEYILDALIERGNGGGYCIP